MTCGGDDLLYLVDYIFNRSFLLRQQFRRDYKRIDVEIFFIFCRFENVISNYHVPCYQVKISLNKSWSSTQFRTIEF